MVRGSPERAYISLLSSIASTSPTTLWSIVCLRISGHASLASSDFRTRSKDGSSPGEDHGTPAPSDRKAIVSWLQGVFASFAKRLCRDEAAFELLYVAIFAEMALPTRFTMLCMDLTGPHFSSDLVPEIIPAQFVYAHDGAMQECTQPIEFSGCPLELGRFPE